MASLLTDPYPTPDGPITYSALVSALLGVLYHPLDWQSFAEELQALYAGVFPSELRASAANDSTAAAALLARAESTPRWSTDSAAPTEPPIDSGQALFTAVTCSDSINPRSEPAWATAGAREDRRARYFGRAWTWAGENCASWALPGIGRYLGP